MPWQWKDANALRDRGYAVMVPDSHHTSAHYGSTGERLMLRYLRRSGSDGRRGAREAGRAGVAIKAFSRAAPATLKFMHCTSGEMIRCAAAEKWKN